MTEEKVLDKIRKVLAMTKSSYREEAEAALLKAQELMAQHGLTMAEVEIEREDKNEKQVTDTCISQKRRNAWYEKTLANIIGNNFRCGSYTTLGRGIYFIGLKEDVEIAREVFHYALTAMLYLADEYVKCHKDVNWMRFDARGIKNDYITGFLSGLRDKYREQVESKGYALILVKDALVVKAMEKKKLKKRRDNNHVTSGSSLAFDAGYEDGRSFDEKRKMIR